MFLSVLQIIIIFVMSHAVNGLVQKDTLFKSMIATCMILGRVIELMQLSHSRSKGHTGTCALNDHQVQRPFC